MQTETQVETVRSMTNREIVVALIALQAEVASLKAAAPAAKSDGKEMTDDDAKRIMFGGDLYDKSHKDAAATLGLSYGQIYSCRGEYTFKAVHKALKATDGYKNRFIK